MGLGDTSASLEYSTTENYNFHHNNEINGIRIRFPRFRFKKNKWNDSRKIIKWIGMSEWVSEWVIDWVGGTYTITKEITLQNYFAFLLIPRFNQIRKIDGNSNSEFPFSVTLPFGIRIGCDRRVTPPGRWDYEMPRAITIHQSTQLVRVETSISTNQWRSKTRRPSGDSDYVSGANKNRSLTLYESTCSWWYKQHYCTVFIWFWFIL